MFRQSHPKKQPAAHQTISQQQQPVALSNPQPPLHNALISLTGFLKGERDVIQEKIRAMGGEVNAEFTPHITHLIAKKVGSPKYQVALDMGVPVVTPAWLEFLHSQWTKGEPINLKELTERFITGPLNDCSICVTGFPAEKYTSALQWGIHCVTRRWLIDTMAKKERVPEDAYSNLSEGQFASSGGKAANGSNPVEIKSKEVVQKDDDAADDPTTGPDKMYLEACQIFLCPSIPDIQVARLKRMIHIAGGVHVTDYDPLEVTHVLVPSDKMEPRQVYNTLALFNHEQNLPYIVHLDWLRRSNRERKVLQETDFIVPFPTWTEDGQMKQRGFKGAKSTWTTDPILQQKQPANGGNSKSDNNNDNLTTLRSSSRSSSATTVVSDSSTDSASPKTSPMGRRVAVEHRGIKPGDGDSSISTPSDSSPMSPPSDLSPQQVRRGMRTRSVSGILSDALGDLTVNGASAQRLLSGGGATQDSPLGGNGSNNPGADFPPVPEEEEPPSSNIFLGLYITSRGCKAEPKIREETIAGGGTYFDAAEGLPPEVNEAQVRTIVPLSMPWEKAKDYPGVVMTICWFEKSLAEERVIPRGDHFLFKPMKNTQVQGFEHLRISVSSIQMTEMEYRHVERAIKIVGGTFQDKLHTAETDVLIADEPKGPKYEFMAKHGRPVVKMEWLKQCIEEGKALPFKAFLLDSDGCLEQKDDQQQQQDNMSGSQSIHSVRGDDSPRSNTSMLSVAPATVISTQQPQQPQQQPEPCDQPLQDLVICLPGRVMGDQREMQDMITQMGGRLLTSYDSLVVSHLVHKGKATIDAKRDLKAAKRDNIFVVSPEWLYKCQECGLRVDEREYPETYDGRHLTLATTTTHLRSPQERDRPALAVLPRRQSSSSSSASSVSSPSLRPTRGRGASGNGIGNGVGNGSSSHAGSNSGSGSRKKTPGVGFGRAATTGYHVHRHQGYANGGGTGAGQPSPTQTFQGTAAGAVSAMFGADSANPSQMMDSRDQSKADISMSMSGSGPEMMDVQSTTSTQQPRQNGNGHSDSFVWQPMSIVPVGRTVNTRKRRRAPPVPGDTQSSTIDMDLSAICEASARRLTPDETNDGSSIPENYFDQSADRYGDDAVYWVDVEGREKKRALLESLGYKTYKPVVREESNSRLEALSRDLDSQRYPLTRYYFMLTGISLVDRGQYKKTIQELGGVVLEDVNEDHAEWKDKCTHLVTNGNNPPRTAKLVIAKACNAIIVNKGFLVASREHGAFVDETPFRVNV
ncbi:DNA topoisomerase 2-binding protein 1 [Mortierella claussenii]|nr:DNA topoisomerase 2-binding protein 1 [Mortierella claussenii]